MKKALLTLLALLVASTCYAGEFIPFESGRHRITKDILEVQVRKPLLNAQLAIYGNIKTGRTGEKTYNIDPAYEAAWCKDKSERKASAG